jgi:L-cystine uptake protein TcyP (sodium:dicarboxylate symporter family)
MKPEQAVNIAKGMTQYDAYKDAYDTETDDRATVDNNAYELAKNKEITARIEELRNKAVKDIEITLNDLLKDLDELKKKSMIDNDRSNAIKAIVEQGKLLGFYVTKTESKEVDQFSKFLDEVKEDK